MIAGLSLNTQAALTALAARPWVSLAFVEITGRLVRLRGLEPEDVQGIAANAADPEVVRHLSSWAWLPYGVEDAQAFMDRNDPGSVNWAVESLEDGAFLGTTGLYDIDQRNRHCHWGIAIGPPGRWGRGFGSEACRLATRWAFDHLGLEKVYLEYSDGNERGRRAYEKSGYRPEGTLPRHKWQDGGLVTVHLMAAYRDDPLYA